MKRVLAFGTFIVLLSSVLAYGVKPCKNTDLVISGSVIGTSITEWMTSSNDCCEPSSGSAMVSQNFYDSEGHLLLIIVSYIPIYQAQDEMGCGV